MKSTKAAVPQAKPPKRVYRTPVLSLFGDVRHLTSGGGGMKNDGGGMRSRMCWIAEALYGVDTPRVILVRGWLAECYGRGDAWALVVVPLYDRFGERAAAAIRVFPLLGHLFRPLFDAAVLMAHRDVREQASVREQRVTSAS
ncbi:MAG: hypothetical protein IPP91_04900 [Betaproteobacteria bacterium]|nr:hypothetical protein [Betaproteobacteria bacterium]